MFGGGDSSSDSGPDQRDERKREDQRKKKEAADIVVKLTGQRPPSSSDDDSDGTPAPVRGRRRTTNTRMFYDISNMHMHIASRSHDASKHTRNEESSNYSKEDAVQDAVASAERRSVDLSNRHSGEAWTSALNNRQSSHPVGIVAASR